MDESTRTRIYGGCGIGLTVVGVFAPYVWHDMPPHLSYPALIGGVCLMAWGGWPLALASARRLKQGIRWRPPAEDFYFGNRDHELGQAIMVMAFDSAWGKWYAAQTLINSGMPIQEPHLTHIAAHLVQTAAMDWKLEIRGRLPDAVDYVDIPREAWRLAALDMEPDPNTLWRTRVVPRADVDEGRINDLLSYDSLIVDSRQFESLWPHVERQADTKRRELLKTARKKGLDAATIQALSRSD